MAATPPTSYPKDKIKVLLLENIHQTGRQIFATEGFQVEALSTALPPDELARRIADVHVLGIRSKTRVTAEALANARRLLALGCFCIGTNQVDLVNANERGIPVFNAPFSNTRSVAELAIAQIISLARQMTDRSREVHEGKWNKVATNSFEVRAKTLGIIGYGHIGRQLGVLAESMGLRVVFYDIIAKLPMGNNQAAETMDEVLAQADFVSLHVPETPQTKNLIGAAELAKMKRGSYLLNLARGTVVVIEALADALRSGHLAGAAIDVYPEEPESNGAGFTTPLQGLANVILTPHVAGSTSEAQAAIGREVATALTKLVNSGATTGAVNFPQVELAPARDTHRILNIHRNVPGVLRDINRIVSERNANIQSQVLATDPKIGYVVMDIDRDVSQEVYSDISALDASIKTRILY